MRSPPAPRLLVLLLGLLPLLAGFSGPERWMPQRWVVLNPKASLAYMRYDTIPSGQYRIHVLNVDLADRQVALWPVTAVDRARPDELALRYGAVAAINGGFFNLSDGASVSYVVAGGNLAADPTQNASLMRDNRLHPFLSRVLNRSELRIVVDAQRNRYFTISPHTAAIPRGYRLLNSLQAGPSLLPAVRLREEAFVRPATSQGPAQVAINALGGSARSAIGLVTPQRAFLVMVERNLEGNGPQGMSIAQLARLMKSLGCYRALALDGGTSSSLFVQTEAMHPPQLISGQPDKPPAAVKSALLVFYRGQRLAYGTPR